MSSKVTFASILIGNVQRDEVFLSLFTNAGSHGADPSDSSAALYLVGLVPSGVFSRRRSAVV